MITVLFPDVGIKWYMHMGGRCIAGVLGCVQSHLYTANGVMSDITRELDQMRNIERRNLIEYFLCPKFLLVSFYAVLLLFLYSLLLSQRNFEHHLSEDFQVATCTSMTTLPIINISSFAIMPEAHSCRPQQVPRKYSVHEADCRPRTCIRFLTNASLLD